MGRVATLGEERLALNQALGSLQELGSRGIGKLAGLGVERYGCIGGVFGIEGDRKACD